MASWRKLLTAFAALFLHACGGSPPGAQGPAAPSSPSAISTFDPDVLHTVQLSMAARDWDTLRANFHANTYYEADVTLDGERLVRLGVRSRGSGTRNARKPALNLDFDRYVSGQRFRGLESLVLENLYGDASCLHERLAFQIFEAMGLPAPQNAFARVSMNGVFWGVYAMVEPVDARFVTNRLSDEGGTLYEYEAASEPPTYDLSYRGPDPASYIPVPFEPKTNERTYDPAPLVDFLRTLSQAPDATFDEEIAAYVDPRRVMTQLAVEQVMAEVDGLTSPFGINNFYLYQHRGQTRFTILPWDRDFSFARSDWPLDNGVNRNLLVRRLLASAQHRAFFVDRVRQVLAMAVNASVLRPRIESAYSLIRTAVREDPNKLFSDRGQDTANSEFEAAVERLRRFAAEREAAVRAQLP
jgi:spore coat protein CotH